jgi:small conductance mechanosensitive channel
MEELSLEKILGELYNWGASFLSYLPNLALALAVLLLFIFFSRITRKLTAKVLPKMIKNEAIAKLLTNISVTSVLVIAIFIILGILDLDKAFTSLLAGAGIVGLALALAFQEPVINLLSGIDLATRKTYAIGDFVETNNYLGFVQKISLRTTILKTTSGQDVVIPNKQIAQSSFTNFTLTQERRIELECSISYKENLNEVEIIARESLLNLDGILKESEINFYYTGFGNSGVDFVIHLWSNTGEQSAFLKLRHQAIIALKSKLDDRGLTIPYPTSSILINPKKY